MANQLVLNVSTDFNAPLTKVWEALTNPEIVKQYFFGTELITDWKVGSSILWKGVWDGTAYEDKGMVLAYEHQKSLKYNYWSSFSGTEDRPENYSNITYEVFEIDGRTTLLISQDGLENQEKSEHSSENWRSVMNEMKVLIEK